MALPVIRPNKHALLLAVALVAPWCVQAGTVVVNGDVGAGVSDNPGRTPGPSRSSAVYEAGLQFDVRELTRRLTFNLAGDLSYVDYGSTASKNRIDGNAALASTLQLVPDTLAWTLDDAFGQTRRNGLSAFSPGNRENINLFSTGPDLRLRFADSLQGVASARYSRVDYESSPADSDRYGLLVGLRHPVSGTSSVLVSASSERVEPRGTNATAAYDRREAYMTYDLRGSTTQLGLDLGGNQIDIAGARQSGSLLRLKASRRLGARSTLSFDAGREYSDAGSQLGGRGGQFALPDVAQLGLSQTANPFLSRYAQMGLDLQGLRTVLSLSGGWRAEDYTTAGMINRDRLMLSAQLSRRVGPKLEARARVDHWRTTFEGATPDYNETTSQLGLAWAAGRHVSLELSAERYQYSSSIAGASLAENRGWLRVRYGEMIRRSVGGQVVPATLP